MNFPGLLEGVVLAFCRGVISAHPNCAEAFKGAVGIVIVQAAFAAVGITSLQGQGFVIALSHNLSPPSFIKIGMLGAGLSIGW